MDGFYIETKGVPKRKVVKRQQLTVDQKLATMMNEKFQGSGQLKELFAMYQKKNLQTNISEMKTKLKKGSNIDIQNQLSQNNLKSVELADEEQINFFMQQICRELAGINTVTLLGLQDTIKEESEPDQQRKLDEEEQWEKLKQIIQKRITKEELQKIFEKEEQAQRKKLVQIYKETKLDQFDIDTRKNKMNMITLKRVQEAYEKQFAELKKGETGPNAQLVQQKFSRTANKYTKPFKDVQSSIRSLKYSPAKLVSPLEKELIAQNLRYAHKMNVKPEPSMSGYFVGKQKISYFSPQEAYYNHQKSQSLPGAQDDDQISLGSTKKVELTRTTRPYSSMMAKQSQITNSNQSIKPAQIIQGFIEQCISSEQESKHDHHTISSRIDEMESELELTKQLRMITSIQGNTNQSQPHVEFVEFVKESKFKKKLINYLLQRTNNKSHVLSQKTIQRNTRDVIQSLT